MPFNTKKKKTEQGSWSLKLIKKGNMNIVYGSD